MQHATPVGRKGAPEAVRDPVLGKRGLPRPGDLAALTRGSRTTSPRGCHAPQAQAALTLVRGPSFPSLEVGPSGHNWGAGWDKPTRSMDTALPPGSGAWGGWRVCGGSR